MSKPAAVPSPARIWLAFAPRLTEPYQITYRDVPVYGPILPNGCLSALQILHMLECLPIVPDDQALYWHQLAEVVKQAWRDRLRYVGDPDFVDVPVERLLSKDYAAGRVEALRQFPERVDQQVWEASGPSRRLKPCTFQPQTPRAISSALP